MECTGLACFRSVGSSRTMLTALIHLLIVSVAFGAARRFDDQPCRPRPQVVKLEDDNGNAIRPYHVLMYHCMGTCDDTSPKLKPCTAGITEEIEVSAHTAARTPITMKVVNHTTCSCNCDIHCDYLKGEQPDDNCKCTSSAGPRVAGVGDKNPSEKSHDSLPFIIGMATVGFFAICVLVFDAIMCARGLGVLHSIKTGCCTRRERRSQRNGCANSPTHEITAL